MGRGVASIREVTYTLDWESDPRRWYCSERCGVALFSLAGLAFAATYRDRPCLKGGRPATASAAIRAMTTKKKSVRGAAGARSDTRLKAWAGRIAIGPC
jgi:hypothetical protein